MRSATRKDFLINNEKTDIKEKTDKVIKGDIKQAIKTNKKKEDTKEKGMANIMKNNEE